MVRTVGNLQSGVISASITYLFLFEDKQSNCMNNSRFNQMTTVFILLNLEDPFMFVVVLRFVYQNEVCWESVSFSLKSTEHVVIFICL